LDSRGGCLYMACLCMACCGSGPCGGARRYRLL